MEEMQVVEITVRVWIKAGADVVDTINEADYEFTHENIFDTEIVDINNEL